MCSHQRPLGERIKSHMNPLPLFHKCPSYNNETQEYRCENLIRGRELLGLPADNSAGPRDAHPERFMWSRIRLLLREPLLEFWGCFIMVLMGNSVIAQTYLSNREYGSWINICFGWACGVAFGIYVAGDSGAYLNPAVTLTNCLFRGLPLRRFPTYAAAQLLGMFCAAGVVYANYVSAFDHYEGKGIRTIPPSETSSATIFCTFPATFVPKASQFFSEYIANFDVMFCIFAMRDENGADLKGGGFFVLALFLLNLVLISSFGWETGSPINPARDLTGRIWLSILGYEGAWTAFNRYSWIPIVVPFIATTSGAIAYDLFIYTGDSPINTTGLGFSTLCSKICRERKKRPMDEESKGSDETSNTYDWARSTSDREGAEERKTGTRRGSDAHKDTGYDRRKDGRHRADSAVNRRDDKLQNKPSRDGDSLKSLTFKDNEYNGKHKQRSDRSSNSAGASDPERE